MKKSLLLILLFASLAFNLGFVIGHLRTSEPDADLASENVTSEQQTGSESASMLVRVTQLLDLSPQQQSLFSELHEKMQREDAFYRGAMEVIRAELTEALQENPPNSALIQDLSSRELELHRERKSLAARSFQRFAEALSPEQRETLTGQIRHLGWSSPRHGEGAPPRHRDRGLSSNRPPNQDLPAQGGRESKDGWGSHGDRSGPFPSQNAMIDRWKMQFLRQFDQNRDGELDDAERALAEAAWEERRSRSEDRLRSELFRRFDLNENGELDQEERDAFFAWLSSKGNQDGIGQGRGRGHSGDRRRGNNSDRPFAGSESTPPSDPVDV